jgi:hypothetical protein
VPKVQHKPIKIQERIQIKRAKGNRKAALVWRTRQSGVPPDSVRCTRENSLQLLSFGFQKMALRYNSPDCPVCQAEQRLPASTVVCNATVNSEQCRLRVQSQSRRQIAHRTVNKTCPVHHRTVQWPRCQKLQWSEPNGLVMWLAHQTVSGGAPDCPVRHTTEAFINGHFGGWGYKSPPTTTLQCIQVFSHQTSYKSSRLHSKTQT